MRWIRFRSGCRSVLVKSWREAKLHTSWSNPDRDYEAAVADFVTTILTPAAENRFLPDFVNFQERVAATGACLSLAQTLLRLVSPGVPDIYQGAEFWELSLVDPDNRRPVDFSKLNALLADLADRRGPEFLKNWQNGSVKQYVIQQALSFRRDHPEVFRAASIYPLEAVGHHAATPDRVCAPLRNGMDYRGGSAFFREAVKIAPCLGKGSLVDTDLAIPPNAPRRWSNLFTGESIEVSGTGRMAAAALLGRFPIALLTAIPD